LSSPIGSVEELGGCIGADQALLSRRTAHRGIDTPQDFFRYDFIC
jgi:hypothetical protein